MPWTCAASLVWILETATVLRYGPGGNRACTIGGNVSSARIPALARARAVYKVLTQGLKARFSEHMAQHKFSCFDLAARISLTERIARLRGIIDSEYPQAKPTEKGGLSSKVTEQFVSHISQAQEVKRRDTKMSSRSAWMEVLDSRAQMAGKQGDLAKRQYMECPFTRACTAYFTFLHVTGNLDRLFAQKAWIQVKARASSFGVKVQDALRVFWWKPEYALDALVEFRPAGHPGAKWIPTQEIFF